MKLRLPVLAVLIAGNAAADPIVVVDGATMQPIEGAIVHVGDRDIAAAQADVDVGVEITVTAPGYDPATQPAAEIVLLFRQGEVIAVHAQAPRASADTAYVLSRDEIRHLPGGSTDALAGVRSLPGVGTGGAVAAGRLVIRGGAPQDSLLEVDGVPVPFIYHAFDNTTILPVSMIGAMSYSPGGFGVDEGRATSGSVGIATADEQAAHASATGSLSMLDASATGAIPLGHGVTLSGGVRRSTVDLLIPIAVPASVMIGFTTPPRYYDGQLRLDWAHDTDRVTLLALTSFDQLGIVNHMTDSDLPPDFDQHMSFGRAIASWKHEDGPVRNRFVAALGDGEVHARFDTIQHVDDANTLAIVRDDLAVAATDAIHLRAGAFAEIEHHDLDARSILVPTDGLPSGHFGDLPIYTIHQPYDANYAAAYAATDLAPTPTTAITAGVRVDYFGHLHAAVVEPRIEIAQRVAELTLHAAAGRYARDLNQVEGIPTSLAPERATQLSGGADVDLADGLTATASVYHTARTDLAVDDATIAPLPYASTGTGTSNGVDLMLRLHTEHAFGWLAYSYGKTTRRDAPMDPSHPTPFDQTHTLTAVASYQAGPWSFGGRFQLATGLPYTEVAGATWSPELGRYLPVLGTPYGTRYPDVAQLDVRIERSWRTRWGHIAAFVDVTNLFHDARVQRYTYSADFSSKQPLTEYIPLPSIGVRGEI